MAEPEFAQSPREPMSDDPATGSATFQRVADIIAETADIERDKITQIGRAHV